MNYYEILGITLQATQSEIKAAYYRLSKELHPDKLSSDTPPMAKKVIEDKFKEITEAYSCLSNPEQRQEYDLMFDHLEWFDHASANVHSNSDNFSSYDSWVYYQEQVERDRQRLKKEEEAKEARMREEIQRDFKRIQRENEIQEMRMREEIQRDFERIQREQEQKREEIQKDYERITQPLEPSNLKIENNLRVTTSTTYINDFSYSVFNVGLGFMGTGALAGIGTYSTLGSMGLVGGFGGIGLGLGTMTGTGAILGAATYGAFTAIKESDATALEAIGLGTVGGMGISATVGGMGLGVGGTAFGIGMGTMAVAGGIVGLGIYGISKIFTNSNKQARMYRTLNYLETITREYEEEQKWRDLESGYLGVDAELEALKASFGLNN